jgi:general secretion pathway protein D
MDLRDADLKQAVAMLTQKSQGVNIVIQSVPGKDFGRVNVKLNDVPLDRALRTIAASADAVLKMDEGIFYLRPRGENEAFGSTSESAATKAVQEVVAASPVVQAPRQLVAISLTYLKPSDFKRVLTDPDFLAMREDLIPSQPSGPNVPVLMPEQLNDQGQMNSTTKMKPGTDGTSTIYKGPNSVGSAGTAGQNDPSFGAAGRLQGGFQGGFPGGGGQGGFPGGQGGQGGQGQGQNGQQRSLTPAGVDNIISNDADNTLIVQGDAPGIEELRQIIRLLDVAPKQVLIKAEFVRVDLSDADSFGINWQLTPSPNTSASTAVFGAGNSISAIYASGNAVANLRATLTRSTTNILQAPIISTSNNRPASVFVNDFIPIQQTIQNITPQGQVITNNVVQFIQVSNNLNITPHINGDNSVSLLVAPQIQTNGASAITGVPRITIQGLSTFRRIANGESMVLGGFITKQENRATNDVPFLSKLPIVGNLFRSYDRTLASQEVLIFLTPTVIEDRAQGVIGTSGGSPPPTP